MENKRKGVYFTSDLHVGHANVLNFDKRPFTDLDHMHTVLVNNYNSTVPDDGICYFLGDVGISQKTELVKFMKRLNNSTKVLILGNHDRNTYSMYDAGFDVVLNAGVFYIGDKRISMSHCPLPGIYREDITGMKGAKDGEFWHGEFKNTKFISRDNTVDFHIHGHIHSNKHNGKLKFTDKQFDVGVPNNSYRPVSISEIESWVNVMSSAKEVIEEHEEVLKKLKD